MAAGCCMMMERCVQNLACSTSRSEGVVLEEPEPTKGDKNSVKFGGYEQYYTKAFEIWRSVLTAFRHIYFKTVKRTLLSETVSC